MFHISGFIAITDQPAGSTMKKIWPFLSLFDKQEAGSPSQEVALLLHRKGFDCSAAPQPPLQCTWSSQEEVIKIDLWIFLKQLLFFQLYVCTSCSVAWLSVLILTFFLLLLLFFFTRWTWKIFSLPSSSAHFVNRVSLCCVTMSKPNPLGNSSPSSSLHCGQWRSALSGQNYSDENEQDSEPDQRAMKLHFSSYCKKLFPSLSIIGGYDKERKYLFGKIPLKWTGRLMS